MMSNDPKAESFLNRWSRQKRGMLESAPAPEPSGADTSPEIDPATLPKIEELTAESDITAFLQKGVPEALKSLALRRMWSLDPAIRDFVEMAENQWNFNVPGGIPGLFQDVPPGTDVSVWLTQATQSVAFKAPEKNADGSSAPDPTPLDERRVRHAAAQHDEQSDTDEHAESVELAAHATPTATIPALQTSDQAAHPVQSSSPTVSDSVSNRRRHGGALPA
jgi:hypothetical protein